MSMKYICDTYKVPAKRGARVCYLPFGEKGTITGTEGAHIRVRLDNDKRIRLFHPTWKIEYL